MAKMMMDSADKAATDPQIDVPPAHEAEILLGEPRPFGWFGRSADHTAEHAPVGDVASPAPASEPSGLLARLSSKLGDVLGDVLSDVSALEVKTYTSEDLGAVSSGGALGSSAKLRAYTKCELDGDVEACVPVNASGAVDEALWALHVEMVKQAQAHRAELIKTVLAMFSKSGS
jgi:hypothetical protein